MIRTCRWAAHTLGSWGLALGLGSLPLLWFRLRAGAVFLLVGTGMVALAFAFAVVAMAGLALREHRARHRWRG